MAAPAHPQWEEVSGAGSSAAAAVEVAPGAGKAEADCAGAWTIALPSRHDVFLRQLLVTFDVLALLASYAGSYWVRDHWLRGVYGP